jgi:hypothetical protein
MINFTQVSKLWIGIYFLKATSNISSRFYFRQMLSYCKIRVTRTVKLNELCC